MERKVLETVPGKQLTMAHVIANPAKEVIERLGLPVNATALGVMTLTPGEVAIIAVDIAKKSADVEIGFVDRFSGSVFITGSISSVKEAMLSVSNYLEVEMNFTSTELTWT